MRHPACVLGYHRWGEWTHYTGPRMVNMHTGARLWPDEVCACERCGLTRERNVP